MHDAPRDQCTTPVAHKDEEEQGADERQPVAIDLFTDLITCKITQVIPQELKQVLHAARIALHLASADDNDCQKGSDHNPGAQEDLAMDVEISDLPIEVFANLEFGKGEV